MMNLVHDLASNQINEYSNPRLSIIDILDATVFFSLLDYANVTCFTFRFDYSIDYKSHRK